MSDIHSCSYYCTRPACVLAQRDELRDKMLVQAEAVDKWLTDDLPQVDKEQAEPVAWVGLTNKELYDCWPESNEPVAIARAIEAAFKKKNAQQAEPVVDVVLCFPNEQVALPILCQWKGHVFVTPPKVDTLDEEEITLLNRPWYPAAQQAEPLVQTFEDVLAVGLGIMQGDKRIDPASIYKEQAEPVAWVGLTDKDRLDIYGQASTNEVGFYARAIEAALKQKNAKPVQAEPVQAGDIELPPLPPSSAFSLTRSIYTADDMCDYARTAIARAEQQAEPVALNYARRLAQSIWTKHYNIVEEWKPLDDLIGVLTQIDHMTSGLVRQQAEPVADDETGNPSF